MEKHDCANTSGFETSFEERLQEVSQPAKPHLNFNIRTKEEVADETLQFHGHRKRLSVFLEVALSDDDDVEENSDEESDEIFTETLPGAKWLEEWSKKAL